MPFTHLKTHTHYSFLQGLGRPQVFVKQAKELGMKALAITDSWNLHGAFEFYQSCKKEDIQPIIGAEIYITPGHISDRPRWEDTLYSFTLLAKNFQGYKNLVALVTDSCLNGMHNGRPRVDFETLQKYTSDMIGLSGNHLWELGQAITVGKKDAEIMTRIEAYKWLFAESDYYLEIQEHADRSAQWRINEELVRLGQSLGVPLVATCDVHYATTDDAEAQDLLSCLASNKSLDDPDRRTLIDGNYSLRPESEMEELFWYAKSAIASTEEIRQKIDIEFPYWEMLLPHYELNTDEAEARDRYNVFAKKYTYPEIGDEEWLLRYNCVKWLNVRFNFWFDEHTIFTYVMKADFTPEEKDLSERSPEELRALAHGYYTSEKIEHLEWLTDAQKEIIDRLDYELIVIDMMGYNAYFIIVADFIMWAKRRDIPVWPGRGSAAWALIAYLSEITNIDPLEHGLLFERFLNPARVSMPDIDIDFSDESRDQVIDYVRDKYWADHVAQICTFGTMAARAAVKDVGRALWVPFDRMNEFVKMMPNRPGITIEQAYEESKELQEACQHDPRYQKIINNAKRLEGTVRQLGVHACAVIIAPSPMTDFCPVQHPPKDDTTIVTQFSAYPLEDIGLLKMDFLWLRNLTIIDRCIQVIKNTKGDVINIDDIPMNDQKVFEVFADGDTTWVFQFESAGMRRYLKELKPNRFEDIIVMVSLYRPGPLMYIPTYIKRKHGKEKVKYPHPSVADILQVTQGIAVYQEQIMQIVQEFAGFSLGEADILRRAMGKKIASLMDAQKSRFYDAAKELWHDPKIAKSIFEDIIEPFAGYGFNKSHAACYALIAYQTAYLKAYYPTEFITSLLVSDEEDSDRVILEIGEAREKGIEILVPDVNESWKHFTFIDDKNIRFWLLAIKWLGSTPADKIKKVRDEWWQFVSLTDFVERVGSEVINKKSLGALIYGWAMDAFWDRATLAHNIPSILAFQKEFAQKSASNQMWLFDMAWDMGWDSSESEINLVSAPKEWSYEEKLANERTVLWLSVSWSPLDWLEAYIARKSVWVENVFEALEVMDHIDEENEEAVKMLKDKRKELKKKSVQILGHVVALRRLRTKWGDPMMIIECESIGFRYSVPVFPRDYDRFQAIPQEWSLLLCKGNLDIREQMREVTLKPESMKSASVSAARNAARTENLFWKKSPIYQIASWGTPWEEWDTKVGIPPEEDDQLITIEIPVTASKDDLVGLKEYLWCVDRGTVDVHILIQGKDIDTKLPVSEIKPLVEWCDERGWEYKLV